MELPFSLFRSTRKHFIVLSGLIICSEIGIPVVVEYEVVTSPRPTADPISSAPEGGDDEDDDQVDRLLFDGDSDDDAAPDIEPYEIRDQEREEPTTDQESEGARVPKRQVRRSPRGHQS